MITLNDLIDNNSYENTKNWALVFDTNIKEMIMDINSQYGGLYFVPSIVPINNNKWMLCADILSEINEDGLFYNVWQFLDHELLLANTEILSISDVSQLIDLGVARTSNSFGFPLPGGSASGGGAGNSTTTGDICHLI